MVLTMAGAGTEAPFCLNGHGIELDAEVSALTLPRDSSAASFARAIGACACWGDFSVRIYDLNSCEYLTRISVSNEVITRSLCLAAFAEHLYLLVGQGLVDLFLMSRALAR